MHVLIGILKERHQANLARILIFFFLRMAEAISLFDFKLGRFKGSLSLLLLPLDSHLLSVVLNLESGLFIFLYLDVLQPFHEQLLLVIHRWSGGLDRNVDRLLLQEGQSTFTWGISADRDTGSRGSG